jgi:hypothetical protein
MASSAESNDDAENGLIFMREMIELMKDTNSFNHHQHLPLTVIPLMNTLLKKLIHFTVATAQFGKPLHQTQGVNFHLKKYLRLFILFRYLLNYMLFNHFLPVRIFYFLLMSILGLASFAVVIVCLLKKLDI